MNKLIIALVATCLIPLSMAEARELKLGHAMPEVNAQHKGLVILADEVKEMSGGDLTIRIYPNAQLGSERDQAEQVMTGALDIAKINGSLAETFEPRYKVMSLPFLFRDPEHMQNFMRSDVAQDLMSSSRDHGFIGLTLIDAGSRGFYGHKPFYTPADLTGLKVRVPESKTLMRMVELLGGRPTPMPWNESYTGLQQGIMDAAENPVTGLVEARHAEVAKNYSYDEHTMTPDLVLISTATWDSLKPKEQEIMRIAARKALEEEIKLWKEAEADNKAKALEMGVKFYDVDKGLYRAKVQPMIDEALKDPMIGDYVRRIQEIK